MDQTIKDQGLRSASWRALKCFWICGLVFIAMVAGCAHYPVNEPLKQVDPQAGYRGRNLITPANDDQLLLLLSFSGGGTRAAALSYGVLKTLRDTKVHIRGREEAAAGRS